MKLCHCGSGSPYDECCGPFITGARQPPTAEALMRSRYSAYAEHAVHYLVDTCIEEGREKIDLKQTKNWSEKSRWLGLEILSVSQGGAGDSSGEVEFKAAYERQGLREVHHERSQFKKIGGRWFYDEGEVIPQTVKRTGPKTGRNDPCPCGSGKKYKHCCGR